MFNWLIKKCRESELFADLVLIGGIILMTIMLIKGG